MNARTVNTLPAARLSNFRRKFVRSIPYYVMILLPLAYLLVFKYYPMYGVQIAFKDYRVRAGITGSPWADPVFKHFTKFLSSPSAWSVIINTLVISLYQLLASFPIPILLAIALNEVSSARFRKGVQMITYMPYFISTVVLVSMILQFTDMSSGFINQINRALGAEAVNYMGIKEYFRSIYVWTGVWQGSGYSAVIYLAALAGVNTELYDAALVDGATKLQRIRNVDLPSIAPTIITLFLLNTGSILAVGFEKIYLMQNSMNISVSEVISTYVYKMGIQNVNYSYSTAVGLFNSVVNFAMLVLCNQISKRVTEVGLW
ncbi:MAG: ABC transporter permease [Christensenellales bacterium]